MLLFVGADREINIFKNNDEAPVVFNTFLSERGAGDLWVPFFVRAKLD